MSEIFLLKCGGNLVVQQRTVLGKRIATTEKFIAIDVFEAIVFCSLLSY